MPKQKNKRVHWNVLLEPLHTSPSQQPTPSYDLIRAQPKNFPGDAGLPAVGSISAKSPACKPVAQLTQQQWAGAEGISQLSLLSEEGLR